MISHFYTESACAHGPPAAAHGKCAVSQPCIPTLHTPLTMRNLLKCSGTDSACVYRTVTGGGNLFVAVGEFQVQGRWSVRARGGVNARVQVVEAHVYPFFERTFGKKSVHNEVGKID